MLSEANLNAFAIYTVCTGFLPLTAAVGSYFFLDEKVTKNQGLEMMLDKIAKAFIAAAQAPTKSRERHAALYSGF